MSLVYAMLNAAFMLGNSISSQLDLNIKCNGLWHAYTEEMEIKFKETLVWYIKFLNN